MLPPVLNTTSSGVPSATGGLNDKSSGSKTGAIVGGRSLLLFLSVSG